jgi:LemA protein
VLVLVKVGLLFFYYNTFVSLQYDVEEAQAQIDTQLQRRKNVILNLSVMVMEYAEHEKEIFKHATEMRRQMAALKKAPAPVREAEAEGRAPEASRSGQQHGPDDAAGGLEALLSKIFAVAERYPDLRLSESFQRYMDALVDAETKIAEQRMIYNRRANDMSTAVAKFPGFIFARIYGFEPPEFFIPEAEARKPPIVEY